MKHLYGVTTAMVTPFDKNGNVELEKVKRLTEFLIAKGVHCLYPLGTTGEAFRISTADRKAIAETVVKTAAKRATVYIHVGAMNQEDTVELTRHAHAIGADGVGVVTPAFFSVNDREMEEYFVAVASSVPVDFPVYLYNIPQCAGNDLKTAVVQSVANRCKNVVGIKYSFADMIRTNEYLNINDGKFSVVSGVDRLFFAILAMGCDATVSGVACVYPEPFVAIYNAYKVQDYDLARRLQKVANKYCEAMLNGSNMSYYKEGLRMRGIDAGYMKAPQLDLPAEEIKSLRRKLDVITQEAKQAGLNID
ncbi:MAG: dihydrodipicolinate synthase family protein [Firmicutes bacterium]|nr:dihydrodipicolinate synthase family protein [Bacillota bacterium]